MATKTKPGGPANIDLRESDLKGNAYRLNRVLNLIQQRASITSTTVQNFVSSGGGGGGGGTPPPPPSGNSLLLNVSVTAPTTITWSSAAPTDGQILTVVIMQDATGHAVGWDSAWFKFPPILPTTPVLWSICLFTGRSGIFVMNSMPILGRHP